MLYGEYYTEIYLKSEIDKKGDGISRLIEIEKSVPCDLPNVDLICRNESVDIFEMIATQ